ncbi:RHS repeat-associated core domain-containing protein [Chryseobacterium taichungense]|uniref:hypothetical protein n=1 Tax=Chryseobacterium taichungense TaxID=295069 RepID=UPI000B02C8A9|nr:hypothetical protein [Chryseobacterium taichungense]
MKHEGYNNLAGNPAYQYKYNGKELQETEMYDYGARFYMPDIGRWVWWIRVYNHRADIGAWGPSGLVSLVTAKQKIKS